MLGDLAVYSERRAMFRAAPVRFVLCLVLAIVGIGLVILLFWWLKCKFQTLEIRDGVITYRSGVLSKEQIELRGNMVRATRIEQSLMNRLFGVGDIYITSSGSSPEIVAVGMPHPKRVREIITSMSGRL